LRFRISSRFVLYSICFAILVPSNMVSPNALAAAAPNSNSVYRQLRDLLPSGTAIPVSNLTLKRDAATFTFDHGDLLFFGEVDGKVTGAVFEGYGHFHLTPPTAIERRSLEVLTKKTEYDDDFSEAVLRFTDGTAEELRKAAAATGGAPSPGKFIQAAQEFHTFQREHLHENVDLRLLEDVLSPAKTRGAGFFWRRSRARRIRIRSLRSIRTARRILRPKK
jgi:hypothetical protein